MDQRGRRQLERGHGQYNRQQRPRTGLYYGRCLGPGTTGRRLRQELVLLDHGFTPEAIDAETLTLSFQGYVVGEDGVNDGGWLRATFLDAVDAQISVETTPTTVTPAGVYQLLTLDATVPSGTRKGTARRGRTHQRGWEHARGLGRHRGQHLLKGAGPVPSTNPISNEHLAELLQVVLDLVVDNYHPGYAHLHLAGRLQAHLTDMRGKEPLPAELTALRDDIAMLRAAREQERHGTSIAIDRKS